MAIVISTLDIIGYAGSAIAILSFLSASSVRQRLINAIGCLMLVYYCYSMHAYPTAICNACTFGLDLIFLRRLLSRRQHSFCVTDCTVNDGVYKAFIKRHADDIAKYFPLFRASDECQNFVRLIMSDDEIAGILVGIRQGDTIHLTADYSIPQYRDCSVGRYAYTHLEEKGLNLIDVSAASPKMSGYFRNMGFVRQGDKFRLLWPVHSRLSAHHS